MSKAKMSKFNDIVDHLPLLQVIMELPEDQRLIVLEKLDPKAQKALESCVKVYFSLPPKKNKEQFKNLRKTYGRPLKSIISRSGNRISRRKALISMGGNPLAYILSAVLPILISEVAARIQ